MWRLYLIAAGCLALMCVWLYYWLDDRSKKKQAYRRRNLDKGTAVLNKIRAARNDEFAGVIPGTCGQVRPGEWQCNCADQSKPCKTLLLLKSQVEKAEDKANMTDRRGAIAAQKAKKSGR